MQTNYANQDVKGTREDPAVVDSDRGPDFVIKRKRRRSRKSAIDPCLGYYTSTPTPSVVSQLVADLQSLNPDPIPSKATLPDIPSQPTCTAPAVWPDPPDSELLVPPGPTEDHITVEAFLRWSAAADSTSRHSTRKRRKYANLNEDRASPSLMQRTPLPVRRYKKRRRTQHDAKTEDRPPAIRGKAVRIPTRATSNADTRRPIVFSSSQTPPGTPQPKKWRLVDPRTTAVQMLAMVEEKGQLKSEYPLRETHFSAWRPDLVAQRVKPDIEHDVTPTLQLKDPCGTVARLIFIPLEEHENRIASMFRATAPINDASRFSPQFSEHSKGSPSKTKLSLSELPFPTIIHINTPSEVATSTQGAHTEPMPCNGTPAFRRTQNRKRDCLRPCLAKNAGSSRSLQDQSVSLIQRASLVNIASATDQTARSLRRAGSYLGSLAQTAARVTNPSSSTVDAVTCGDASDRSSDDTSQEAKLTLLGSVPISSGWIFRSNSLASGPGDSLSTMLRKRKPRYTLSQLRKPSYLPGPPTVPGPLAAS